MNGITTTNINNLAINFFVSLQNIVGKMNVLNFDFGFWSNKKTATNKLNKNSNSLFPDNNKIIPEQDWHNDPYLSKTIPKLLPNGEPTIIESNPKWDYINADNSFACKFYIINKSILFSYCYGSPKLECLEKTKEAKINVVTSLNLEK
jgi:hypothetical protein